MEQEIQKTDQTYLITGQYPVARNMKVMRNMINFPTSSNFMQSVPSRDKLPDFGSRKRKGGIGAVIMIFLVISYLVLSSDHTELKPTSPVNGDTTYDSTTLSGNAKAGIASKISGLSYATEISFKGIDFKDKGGENISQYFGANVTDGKYVINLPTGHSYLITIYYVNVFGKDNSCDGGSIDLGIHSSSYNYDIGCKANGARYPL